MDIGRESMTAAASDPRFASSYRPIRIPPITGERNVLVYVCPCLIDQRNRRAAGQRPDGEMLDYRRRVSRPVEASAVSDRDQIQDRPIRSRRASPDFAWKIG